MQSLADFLALEEKPAGWGALQGKPMPMHPRRNVHPGVILVGPPLTVTWMMRADETTVLSVRCPLILWSEEDAVILPPDDAGGVPFYVDPSTQPGMHRDMFKTWGRRVAGELLTRRFPMSAAVVSHLPQEYQSDSEESTFSEPAMSE